MTKATPTPKSCWTCRGTGRLTVGAGRGEVRTCPMCRGARHA